MSAQPKVSLQLDTLKYNKSIAINEMSADSVATTLYYNVLEGEQPALQVAEMINFIGKVGELLKKKEDVDGSNKWSDLVRSEITQNSENGKSCVSKYGTTFSLLEAGTKYDYEVCGDPIYNNLVKQQEKLKKEISSREKFLKSLSEEGIILSIPDPESGELLENITIYPPSKTSTSTYKTELLKD